MITSVFVSCCVKVIFGLKMCCSGGNSFCVYFLYHSDLLYSVFIGVNSLCFCEVFTLLSCMAYTIFPLSRYGTTLTGTNVGYVTCMPTTGNRIGKVDFTPPSNLCS